MQEMEEKAIPPEEELRTAQETLHELRKLVERRGWELLVKTAQAHIDQRRMQACVPQTSIEGILAHNAQLAEANGMEFVLKLPGMAIEALETVDIPELKEAMEDESGSNTDE